MDLFSAVAVFNQQLFELIKKLPDLASALHLILLIATSYKSIRS